MLKKVFTSHKYAHDNSLSMIVNFSKIRLS